MKILLNYAKITLSTIIMAVGIYFFRFPNNFCFGGVTGIAVVVARLFPVSAGTFTFIANVILLIVGLIFLGKEFAARTAYASMLLSVLLVIFEKLEPMSHSFSQEPMLDLIFAIALPSLASALLFDLDASSGGTDVIAFMIKKYTNIEDIGFGLFIIDLVMVLIACFVFDAKTALYSFVGLILKSLLIDKIIADMHLSKSIIIMCDDAEEISKFITEQLHKGATITEGIGAYTKDKKYVIFTTLSKNQAKLLRQHIHDNNLNAFISIFRTSEVFGKGFSNL